MVQLYPPHNAALSNNQMDYLVALINAIYELLRWRIPSKFDGGRVDSNNVYVLRGCCRNYPKQTKKKVCYFSPSLVCFGVVSVGSMFCWDHLGKSHVPLMRSDH